LDGEAAVADQRDTGSNGDKRRLFLEKAGRFAVVTPPTVALMLSTTGKARAQATSANTGSVSVTTTVTATATATATATVTQTITQTFDPTSVTFLD
jgi:hypothetical protein